jgi:enoyl-CoA hydratase/carnithine racemase
MRAASSRAGRRSPSVIGVRVASATDKNAPSGQAGRRCLSDEALRIGLVTDVVEPAELLEAAYAKAAEIMLNPPFSVEPAKQGMWASTGHPEWVVGREQRGSSPPHVRRVR